MRVPQSMMYEFLDPIPELGAKKTEKTQVSPVMSELDQAIESAKAAISASQPKEFKRVSLPRLPVSDTVMLNVDHPIFNTLDELLNSLSGFKKQSVIAGGVVRDALLGRPIKDIDVFVTYRTNVDQVAKMIGDFVTKAFGGFVETTSSADGYKKGLTIVNIKDTTLGYPLQIILTTDTLDKHLNSFNLGLSKVSYSENGLQLSKEFLTDVKNSTLTVLVNEGDQTNTYLERIQKKYPEFKVDYASDKTCPPDVTEADEPLALLTKQVNRIFDKAVANVEYNSAVSIKLLQTLLREHVTQGLTNMKMHRQIFDYHVQCDAANNPPSMIDQGRLVIDVTVKPTNVKNAVSFMFKREIRIV